MQHNRVKLWASACFAATVTAVIWLGVIEVSNARVDGVLQQLAQAPPGEPWAYRHFTRESVAAQLAVDDHGQPLAPPYGDALNQRIDRAFAMEAGRNHLYRLLVGFGPTLYLLLAIAATTAVLLCLSTRSSALRAAAGVCVLICAVLLWRAWTLGVLRYGVWTALGWA